MFKQIPEKERCSFVMLDFANFSRSFYVELSGGVIVRKTLNFTNVARHDTIMHTRKLFFNNETTRQLKQLRWNDGDLRGSGGMRVDRFKHFNWTGTKLNQVSIDLYRHVPVAQLDIIWGGGAKAKKLRQIII